MAKKAFVYDGTNWIDIAQSTADLSNYANMTTTPISGFRNAVINGDFRINQRGFSSTTTTATYGVDRWYLETNTGTSTYSAPSFSPGNAISGYEPTNHARIVTSGQSATGSFSLLTQQIEDVRTFAGQTVTVSFWAKAASGTPKVAVTLDQLFGSGGSPSSIVNNLAGTVTLSTSWTRYSLTVTIASISGKTIGTTANTSSLRLRLWVSGGSDLNPSAQSIGAQNNTFDFWGAQVEKGTVATPFEQRFIGTELALCQRYYEAVSITGNNYMHVALGNAMSATNFRAVFIFKVEKRIPPTPIISSAGDFIIDWSTGGITCTAIADDRLSTTGGTLGCTVAGGLSANGASRLIQNNTASASIAFNAEL